MGTLTQKTTLNRRSRPPERSRPLIVATTSFRASLRLPTLVLLTLVLFALGCSNGTATTLTQDPTAAPSATPVLVPTSTPGPTPTPTATEVPLPIPTPTRSAVLLDTAFTNYSKVTTVGIAPLFFGMKPPEAGNRVQTEWVGEPNPLSNCYLITPARGPNGVTFWVVDGYIERVDIAHTELRTPSGYGLGNTIEELQTQLGDRLEVQTQGSTSIATFTPQDEQDRDFRIVFTAVDGIVTTFSSGRVGIIDRPIC